jgi:hypothetical protein
MSVFDLLEEWTGLCLDLIYLVVEYRGREWSLFSIHQLLDHDGKPLLDSRILYLDEKYGNGHVMFREGSSKKMGRFLFDSQKGGPLFIERSFESEENRTHFLDSSCIIEGDYLTYNSWGMMDKHRLPSKCYCFVKEPGSNPLILWYIHRDEDEYLSRMRLTEYGFIPLPPVLVEREIEHFALDNRLIYAVTDTKLLIIDREEPTLIRTRTFSDLDLGSPHLIVTKQYLFIYREPAELGEPMIEVCDLDGQIITSLPVIGELVYANDDRFLTFDQEIGLCEYRASPVL